MDPSYTDDLTPPPRTRHADLDGLLIAFCGKHAATELAEILDGCGVAAAPLLDAPGVPADPHLEARSLFVGVEHPDAGIHPANHFPIKLSGSPLLDPCRAPLFGEHNGAVLVGEGILSPSEFDGLIAAGVVVTEPPN